MAQIIDDVAQIKRSSVAKNFFDTIERATKTSVHETTVVAFDCEGIRLSRLGTIEIVSLYFPASADQKECTFLVDMQKSGSSDNFREERVQALKSLFESTAVIKVIHDCRRDSDALYHLEGIKLTNVHDSSCFHSVISGKENSNLNEVLEYNNVGVNATRDNSIYNTNPTYWSARPLTSSMIQWASADVDKLTIVAKKQLLDLDLRGRNSRRLQSAKDKSNDRACSMRDLKVERRVPLRMPRGQFFGRGGINIRDVQKSTGTIISEDHDAMGHHKDWAIFYPNESALKLAKRRMGH